MTAKELALWMLRRIYENKPRYNDASNLVISAWSKAHSIAYATAEEQVEAQWNAWLDEENC